MNPASSTAPGTASWQRCSSPLKGILLGLLFLSLFAGFVALGTWQVHRLHWKTALIERVESRVHAEPVPAPGQARWASIGADTDEYRHVRVSGHFLHALSTRVFASTALGNGYWLLTPLQLDDGSLVLVNRGFISQQSAATASPSADTPTTITGLLRISEPDGAYLRSNQPDSDRWYSRDVQAIAKARGLHSIGPVAPYFIDAGGKPQALNPEISGQPGSEPVGGLTVIHFHNNHLMYALTWYALALMTAGCGAWLVRVERNTAKPSSA